MPSFVDTAALAERVRGPVLVPGDDNFVSEITAWNLAVAHQPTIAVGAVDLADVVTAVRWAAEHGLRVAVQATGHGPLAGVDGGVLITTHRMNDVSIDPVNRRARVGAGVTWNQVIAAAAEHGLAPLNGSSSGVGVVGYTLGGGLPVMGRTFGFGADRVRSIEVVTAEGRVRAVDADTEPDLFWALRGAGKAGFGIVTAMEFDLVDVRTLYGGALYYPASSAMEVLTAFRSWARTVPEQTTPSVAFMRYPDLPDLPEPLRGAFVVHLRFVHVGGAADGARILAPMRAVAPVLIDTVAEMPYTAVDSIHADPVDPMPMYNGGIVLKDLPPEAIDALIAVAGPQVDLPLAMVELRLLGGALSRPAAVPNAVSGRDGAYSFQAIGPTFAGLEQVVPAVITSVLDALEPFRVASSGLANFEGCAAGDTFDAWSLMDRDRLVLLKKQYDPTGMFGE